MISVITTVKNGEKFLVEMLDSVRNQTFKSFEHIIVDDGSSDKTLELLKNFKLSHPSFNVKILTPGNVGRGVALNLAVSNACYDWIAVIDADDIWHPKKLEIQSDIVSRLNVDVLATDSLLFSISAELIFEEFETGFPVSYYNLKGLLRTNMLSHSSVLVRKELCIYDEQRLSQFDYDLWLRLAFDKKVLAKCDLPLNFHRIHGNQSFEAKMKKSYRWRAYKMKIKAGWNSRNFSSLLYSTGKFAFDMLLPRKIRLRIKKKLIGD